MSRRQIVKTDYFSELSLSGLGANPILIGEGP